MNPTELMHELEARHVHLWREGSKLRYEAPKGAISDLLADIQKFKPPLLELLASKPDQSPQESSKVPTILAKWQFRHIRLWLGTTTQNGVEYRTLEYEADKSIPTKWLKELETEKHDIQLALVAQEVRELSARYWESRREEVEAARIEKAEYPEAFEQPAIDWQQIATDRAMQDALNAKIGPLKAIQAIFRASKEILDLWTPKGRKESPETIQRAALELLCIRHEIDFENMFDTEMASDESNYETPITTETEYEGWYRLSEEHFPTEEDYFKTAIVIDGQLVNLGNAFIRTSTDGVTGKAWMHENMHVELEWEFTHWRHYEDDNKPIANATDEQLKSIQTPIVTSRVQSSDRRKSDADIMREIVEVCDAAKREIAATAEASTTYNSNPPSTLSLQFEMFGDNKR